MVTFREFVGTAYGKGVVRNMSIADGSDGQRPADEVLRDMVAETIALVDGIANIKAMTATDRAAATRANHLVGWLRNLDQSSRQQVEVALTNLKARAA